MDKKHQSPSTYPTLPNQHYRYHRSNAMLYQPVSLFQQRRLEDNCRWHVDKEVGMEIASCQAFK